MPRLRPRWQYLLFALAWLAGGLFCAFIGGTAAENGVSWLDHAMPYPGGVCLGLGLVMLGRAGLVGRLRKSMWRVPPPELDQPKGRTAGAGKARDRSRG
ncbi:hypothetical protein ABT158_23080 [Nonomuraea sp. NPDC001636]|uniref:hypothetical protein n=1 Tax=Nonomuraea sp. NPDC001636 TaxID=3154391 RepID=UPI00331E490D